MKKIIIILTVMVVWSVSLYGQTSNPPPIPSEEEPEVLTRGPVNEAFAQPVTLEEEEGFIVPEAPPPDIEETPPPETPVGERFAWVPGYWAWDSDRNDFIWISGCWRAVPPGKRWVPGYWAEVAGGWRWVAGFWAPVSVEEMEYLPPPPSVVYVEPSGPAPYGKIWVPPIWYWSHGRYTYRAGYWLSAREDWVWIPSHYAWTPRGHVFIDGHWDYPLRGRGVLFAPVYFHGHTHRRFRVSYSLSIVLNVGNLEFGLFTRPRYRHYYFGDYYDSFYMSVGIFPWFECETRRTWYDPIYLHDRWRHRNNERYWRQQERHRYERRRADKRLRPPGTYREMVRRVRSLPESRQRDYEVASPIKRVAENRSSPIRFRKSRPEERRQILRNSNDVHRYAKERSKRETAESIRRSDQPVKRNSPSIRQRGGREPARIEPVRPGESRIRSREIETRKQVYRNSGDTDRNAGERSKREASGALRRSNVPVKRNTPSIQRREGRETSRTEPIRSYEPEARNRDSSNISRDRNRSAGKSGDTGEQVQKNSSKVSASRTVDKRRSRLYKKNESSEPEADQNKRENPGRRELFGR